MIAILSTLTILLLLFPILSRSLKLLINYNQALKLHLPIILTPFSWQDPLWILLSPHLLPLRHLPFNLGAWLPYSLYGWQFADRHETHSRLGPAFVIVSPAKNEVILADHTAAEHVLGKWKEWTRSEDLYGTFGIFGPSVVSVNGGDWQRHRRVTGPAFREGTNAVVWGEAVNQAVATAGKWVGEGGVDLDGVRVHCSLLVLEVLMVAGFGKRSSLEGGGEEAVESASVSDYQHVMTYAESLQVLLENMTLTILVKNLKVPAWLLPKKIRTVSLAIKEFKQYMTEGIAKERKAIQEGGPLENNLASALVQANESAHDEDGSRLVLSDNELYGNLFIFSLAGFETTANALAYALPLLAAHQDVQEWVLQEVQQAVGDRKKASYEETFPHLVRTQAVMYETLRLWGSAQGLSRYTGAEAKQLDISGTSYLIPQDTYVSVNIAALHSDPAVWGSDVLEWRPSRWIKQSETGQDEFAGPPEGAAFVAWACGPRVCPGKKFSQVDFVAVIATMVKNYLILPAGKGRERRLEDVIQDSVFQMSPKPRRPKAAGLEFTLRAELDKDLRDALAA